MSTLTLRGMVSYKTNRELKNPDILYSKVDSRILHKNKVFTKRNDDGTIFLYHMYDSDIVDYTGRWYGTHINNLDVDHNNRTIKQVIQDYDIDLNEPSSSVKNNVEACIWFTENGWKKLTDKLGI